MTTPRQRDRGGPWHGKPAGQRACGGDDAKNGDVLVVVRDERIPHEVDVHQPHHRYERDDEIEPREEQPTDNRPPAVVDQNRGDEERSRERQPPSKVTGVDVPLPIDEHQPDREDRLGEVEPDHRRGAEHPLDDRDIADDLSHVARLQPHVQDGESCGNRKEGQREHDVAHGDVPAPPPRHEKQGRGKHGNRSLAEHREDERRETQPVPTADAA